MIEYLTQLLDLYLDMSFYIVIGLLCTGFLHAFIKDKWIKNQLGGKSTTSLVKAALVGVPLPLCSCGVVPMAVYLRQSGASKGATMSFLTSTPQTGVDSLIASYGLLGPIFAIFRAIAAFISGIITGFFCELLDKDPKQEASSCCGCGCSTPKPVEKKSCGCGCDHGKAEPAEANLSFAQKVKSMFHFAFFDFLDRIAFNFVIGLLIAALISTLLPADLLSSIDNPLISMLLVLILGIPMYVCSTASIPIALSLMMKGLSPGAAFVFLFAGPATNIAALSVLLKAFSKKSIMIYLLSLSLCAIGFGCLLDAFWSVDIMNDIHAICCEEASIAKTSISAIFAILLLLSLFRKYVKKAA